MVGIPISCPDRRTQASSITRASPRVKYAWSFLSRWLAVAGSIESPLPCSLCQWCAFHAFLVVTFSYVVLETYVALDISHCRVLSCMIRSLQIELHVLPIAKVDTGWEYSTWVKVYYLILLSFAFHTIFVGANP